ncbi:hypothetical protein D3C81_2117060 [compost metagenome]
MQIMAGSVKRKLPLPMLHEIEIVCFTGLSQLVLRLVQPVYIALVVFVMMNHHRLLVNIGLQCIVSIGQRRQGVATYRY